MGRDPAYGPDADFAPLDEFEAFVETRRLSQNGLLWQVPGLSLAAQSFLIGAAIDPGVPREIRIAVEVVALLVAVATIQLLMRNRYREHVFSHALDVSRMRRGVSTLDFPDLLEELARRRDDRLGHESHWRSRWLLAVARWPAWKTWTLVFLALIALDLFLVVTTLT